MKDLTSKRFGTEGSMGLIGTILAGGSAGLGYWAIGMPGMKLKNIIQSNVYSILKFNFFL